MLIKLQKKTLVKTQLFGYVLTLLIGVFIIVSTIQLFIDAKPILNEKTDVFNTKTAVISKQVSVFKSIDKQKIYFTPKELEELQAQPFIKNISVFNNANFKIKAFSNHSESIPLFQTDLFFESIPDAYLDVKVEDWQWEKSQNFVPIVIPESYLTLYNFGFAESQGLPVLSKNTISQVEFNLKVFGNNNTEIYSSKIVGFSNKINSILVPEAFLSYANTKFGRTETSRISRVLVELDNLSDDNILRYFNDNNYDISKDKLEFSKLSFIFKSALIFISGIALVIIALSIAFILLSFNLVIQKNKEVIVNLYSIGYSYQNIARFYQVIISIITILAVVLGIVFSYYLRSVYVKKFKTVFDFSESKNQIFVIGFILAIILVSIYNIYIVKNIKKTVTKTN
ncbi:FtsX-like permease family protein [Bizionia paragorgiae]|uniref:FtsX-like permease family protein n=1 Tax=Bizionia paragorgiae TaxID=283786 RepID=A0A1H3X2M1_BIZPA|nr:FtsX-like permease family protein [Bizionia paragorgiae]SDZ93231.1 FtsX-like permease family protein [Bizionia paragorgiae]